MSCAAQCQRRLVRTFNAGIHKIENRMFMVIKLDIYPAGYMYASICIYTNILIAYTTI